MESVPGPVGGGGGGHGWGGGGGARVGALSIYIHVNMYSGIRNLAILTNIVCILIPWPQFHCL